MQITICISNLGLGLIKLNCLLFNDLLGLTQRLILNPSRRAKKIYTVYLYDALLSLMTLKDYQYVYIDKSLCTVYHMVYRAYVIDRSCISNIRYYLS